MGFRGFNRNHVRALLLVVIVLSAAPVVVHGLSSGTDSEGLGHVHNSDAIRSASNLTVVTTHFSDDRKGAIAAFNISGEKVYQNSTYTRYFDVDPVDGEPNTVLYVAEQNLRPGKCGLSSNFGQVCVRQVIEELNLTTDQSRRVYSQTLIVSHTESWHDVDRIDEHRYVVGDIFNDRVFIVNSTTDLVTWEWMASSAYPFDSGSSRKTDWTHLNDVEMVRNGTVMVSVRNHDQIVFIDRRRGLMANWTLGSDDARDTLYEQHNPDYISEERGGPAVVIADSENNRIVEYERENGTWRRTWVWSDAKTEWPRDADRLPNGNTLITDTHSGRIIEINESGSIVWQVNYPLAYEAERLGTGDESTGAQSASRLGLANVTAQSSLEKEDTSPSLFYSVKSLIIDLIPTKLKHGVMWVIPPWAAFIDVLLTGIATATFLTLVLCELYWGDWIGIRSPVTLK